MLCILEEYQRNARENDSKLRTNPTSSCSLEIIDVKSLWCNLSIGLLGKLQNETTRPKVTVKRGCDHEASYSSIPLTTLRLSSSSTTHAICVVESCRPSKVVALCKVWCHRVVRPKTLEIQSLKQAVADTSCVACGGYIRRMENRLCRV